MREVHNLEFADKQVTETFSFYTEELDEVSITLTAFQIAFIKYGYAKKHNMPLSSVAVKPPTSGGGYKATEHKKPH